MLDKKSFGKHVKAARKNNEITAEQLAEKLNISSKSVWQIEGGKSATTLSGLVNICNALHVSPEYLLSGDLDCDLIKLKSDYGELSRNLFKLTPAELRLVNDFVDLLIKNRKDYR